ncbi:hypothetical protein JDV02_010600 [Purpureocillium takamizusanense]|uniref:FAD-binding domain-containing protein n=1 Tax=Purpureocillium takamizusanense TaxID=2060973 RepID=A0A9Q8QT97_9HYPO|nr:uncharacterized protein JDV02_010600 [Purpureocillium takamizusanense]UNI24881.1 hypothetical protein JDV02_010600 [Purpureocillium takamizusanense]
MGASNRTHHFLEGKTIFVAGSGVAGAAFVAGLHKLWDPAWKTPTVVVFDRDPADEGLRRESENYSLSISGHTEAGGLVALMKLGLLDQVFARSVSGVGGSGCFKIWGPDWSEKVRAARQPLYDLPTASVRITRKNLRRVLCNAIEAWEHSDVEWDSQCLSVTRLESGRLSVQVRRGQGETSHILSQECDLLVAADGASSKLRACLRPEDRLEYTGATLRGGLSEMKEGLPAPINKDWGFVVGGDGVVGFVSPVDEHTVMWAVGNHEREPLPQLDRTSYQDVQAVISRGGQLSSELKEPFQTIVSQTDPDTVMYISAHDKMPFRHDQDAIEDLPVIFIGDSNHALSPFAGSGANLALCDAWDLAAQLCLGGSLSEAVAAYDELSEPRARKIIEASRRSMRARKNTGWRYSLFSYMLWVGSCVRWMLEMFKRR